MNIKKIGVGIATSALLALSMAPATFADTNVGLLGNGAFSDSNAHVSNNNSKNVSQTNDTNIRNNVTTKANTGDNTASFNTGGSVKIITGDATSNTNISNAAGSNVASIGGCGCDNGFSSVLVAGNGAFSNNDVNVSNWNRESFRQANKTYFSNVVTNQLNTGHNSANFNTGTDVVIYTGNAQANTSIDNQAGSNVLH
jgi:hypothetical protein